MKLRLRNIGGMWWLLQGDFVLANFCDFASAQAFLCTPFMIKNSLDQLTDTIQADYIRDHLQSRGAPIGRA